MPAHEQRSSDRRRQPRGGRRNDDLLGLTPLVLVVGGGAPGGKASEAVLAKLRFAVAVSETAEQAVPLITALRPDIVIAPAEDVLRIRTAAPEQPRVVVMREDPDLLVQAIRRSLSTG